MKNKLTILLVLLSSILFSNAQENKDLKDPVCRMKVKKTSKITTTHKEKPYSFCSESCKEKFVKNPEKYSKK